MTSLVVLFFIELVPKILHFLSIIETYLTLYIVVCHLLVERHTIVGKGSLAGMSGYSMSGMAL